MNKCVLLLVSNLLLGFSLSAQPNLQNKNWIFGYNVQIEFGSSLISSKSKSFFSIEACATVSDPLTGELLFYSDGVSIMDKNGNMLLNGDSLKGSQTSTQGALIIPHPNFEKKYLLFTTPPFVTIDKGLYYSVIDMNLNNGLGGVVEGQKNILLCDNVTEGLTYTYNADSTGYWLLAHERLSNAFLLFEITKHGIGTNSKKSNIGRIWGRSPNDFMSYFKISPDGKRISVSNSLNNPLPTGQVEVYSFNNCNGSVTDEITINNLPYICYGSAFSSNSNILYITSLQFPSNLYQVDLSAGSELEINGSIKIIYTAPKAPSNQNRVNYFAGLQLYEDGKIYVTESAQKFLHCINDPNKLGNNCNFEYSKINLANGTSSRVSLPQLVPLKLKDPKLLRDSITISINDTCIENIKKGALLGLKNPTSIKWKLINLTNSDTTTLNDSTNYNLTNIAIGEYRIEAIVRQDCKNYLAYKNFKIYDCDCSGKINISDTCVEKDIRLSINSTDPITNIEWIITDNNGNLIFKQKSLNAVFKIDSAQNITITAIVNFNCKIDTLNSSFILVYCPDCENIFIPNALSLNKDGLNDKFEIFTICEVEEYRLSIFNRWGEQVFESTNITDMWDGTFKNYPCQDGVYLFNLSYKFKEKSTIYTSGTVTLLH